MAFGVRESTGGDSPLAQLAPGRGHGRNAQERILRRMIRARVLAALPWAAFALLGACMAWIGGVPVFEVVVGNRERGGGVAPLRVPRPLRLASACGRGAAASGRLRPCNGGRSDHAADDAAAALAARRRRSHGRCVPASERARTTVAHGLARRRRPRRRRPRPRRVRVVAHHLGAGRRGGGDLERHAPRGRVPRRGLCAAGRNAPPRVRTAMGAAGSPRRRRCGAARPAFRARQPAPPARMAPGRDGPGAARGLARPLARHRPATCVPRREMGGRGGTACRPRRHAVPPRGACRRGLARRDAHPRPGAAATSRPCRGRTHRRQARGRPANVVGGNLHARPDDGERRLRADRCDGGDGAGRRSAGRPARRCRRRGVVARAARRAHRRRASAAEQPSVAPRWGWAHRHLGRGRPQRSAATRRRAAPTGAGGDPSPAGDAGRGSGRHRGADPATGLAPAGVDPCHQRCGRPPAGRKPDLARPGRCGALDAAGRGFAARPHAGRAAATDR